MIDDLLSDLISVGQDVQKINRYGREWGFRMITSDEYSNTLEATTQYKNDDMVRMYKMEVEILIHSLVSVNDVKIPDDKKRELFENTSPSVVNALYQEFENMRTENDRKLSDMDKNPATETNVVSSNETIEA